LGWFGRGDSFFGGWGTILRGYLLGGMGGGSLVVSQSRKVEVCFFISLIIFFEGIIFLVV